MICYELICEHEHRFEAWFKDSATYDLQAKSGEVECPYCATTSVRKAVMAPNVATKKDQPVRTSADQSKAIIAAEQAASDMRGGADPQEVAKSFMDAVSKLQEHVEDSCEYVGENFANEARAIHYGDAEERDIYGEASIEETVELRDEGIEVIAIPKVMDKEQAN